LSRHGQNEVAGDPIARLLGASALAVALLALVFSMGGSSPAKQAAHGKKHSKQAGAIGKLSARIGDLKVKCPIKNAVHFKTWCLESSPQVIPPTDVGQNNYFYAAQACVREGGWLPTAAQLIGAAPKAALQSTIDDDPKTSGAEEFPEARRGIKDKHEMTADLFTTAAGSGAAGSEGVTVGSKGNGTAGEPDPVPMPAVPAPETLDYVTVYDNHNLGGFAGGEPVGQAETFRCAYAMSFQGKPKLSEGN
jgi:hypothetical protein